MKYWINSFRTHQSSAWLDNENFRFLSGPSERFISTMNHSTDLFYVYFILRYCIQKNCLSMITFWSFLFQYCVFRSDNHCNLYWRSHMHEEFQKDLKTSTAGAVYLISFYHIIHHIIQYPSYHPSYHIIHHIIHHIIYLLFNARLWYRWGVYIGMPNNTNVECMCVINSEIPPSQVP